MIGSPKDLIQETCHFASRSHTLGAKEILAGILYISLHFITTVLTLI